jgi:triosephosphate isomerase (TIM)
MSKKIFAANWKLNKTPDQALTFAQDFLAKTSGSFFENKEAFIFPQNFSLDAVSRGFKGSQVQFGPQQIHVEVKGAFTGENSLDLAKSLGAQICLIGHSERRQFFAETHSLIHKKVLLCQASDVLPVLCIGESLEQRQKNETLKVCFEQLETALTGVDTTKRIVVAYEPVWAIGTGQVATLNQVKEVHAELYKKMTSLNFKNFQLLYGGSVKSDNAKDLISIPHVDGFLIGGASLEVKNFLDICNIT